MMRRIASILVGVGMLLSGCSQATIQATPTVTPKGVLTPFHTLTSSPQIPTATIEVTIPVTPTLTPTPFIYTVKNDDTMLAIAFQFGIKLEDLQAANPTVDPHYMGEGLKLIIPISEENPEVLPTPTPAPVQIEQPRCYRTGDGGAWCIMALRNDQESSIENLAVWMGLYNNAGENITSQTAYAPLNILRPGSTIPIMAYFAPPLPDEFQAQSKLLSALSVASDDVRYLESQVKADTVEINPDGGGATVKGEVVLPDNSPTLSQLWVLAVAYDADGNIVGARKWKSAGEKEFEFTVFSVAGAIDHVEMLSEARS
jgi:LysM repeat protein